MDLNTFFQENRRVALAFSGGVDSAYLLYAAIQSGADVKAYYAKTAFQPDFEYQDALRLAGELGANMQVLAPDPLGVEEICANPKNRCYYCKRLLFDAILRAAKADGYDLVMDGTNASDDASDRPGMAALRELEVRSPLRECGLTKNVIRRRSKEAGLFTWDKPAYACLATRIPTGDRITAEKLKTTEEAEDFLMQLGFRNFRVRLVGKTAKIQLPESQLGLLLDNRETIVEMLRKTYAGVLLDLEVRDEQ
ncbi:MAG: ATP-dependent sacrificial sulfur transferase LarE [Firmicutes bacterium]|nr:ATP-dependent sacrificial sulfur transferase LarE [Bacillota bacterium]